MKRLLVKRGRWVMSGRPRRRMTLGAASRGKDDFSGGDQIGLFFDPGQSALRGSKKVHEAAEGDDVSSVIIETRKSPSGDCRRRDAIRRRFRLRSCLADREHEHASNDADELVPIYDSNVHSSCPQLVTTPINVRSRVPKCPQILNRLTKPANSNQSTHINSLGKDEIFEKYHFPGKNRSGENPSTRMSAAPSR